MSKFNSLRDEVVYQKSLEWGGYTRSDGEGGANATPVEVYGKHYVVLEDEQGFVYVTEFDTQVEAETMCDEWEERNGEPEDVDPDLLHDTRVGNRD
jgi:hypothetical protein